MIVGIVYYFLIYEYDVQCGLIISRQCCQCFRVNQTILDQNGTWGSDHILTELLRHVEEVDNRSGCTPCNYSRRIPEVCADTIP